MDITLWLRNLGLERYETLFRDHALDLDILADLTEADLEKLAIPLGDRKRLLKGAAALAEAARPPRRGEGERRPITVLFCDIVGSTALAAALDAEDWRELVERYVDAAATAATSLGGHVAKKLGDGLMILFGYPLAQENDAERAARAALAILAAAAAVNAENPAGAPDLAWRIGLDSGSVVIDPSGEVFGETPNVAARVQGAAAPGAALVTAAVQRQIAGLFVVEAQGPRALRGVAGERTLYRLIRPSEGGRRAAAQAQTPFVGREDDLALLTRLWERARSGESQFVFVVGEPGLGKSRLLQELRARLGATPPAWIEWTASQLLQNSPLHPVVEWGRGRFVGLDAEALTPPLAQLLEIAERPAGDPVGDEPRRRQLEAIVEWMAASARREPLVVTLEDLHWADPTSLELLSALVERPVAAPLLIVATSRPEFRPTWPARAHHATIALGPLEPAQTREMIAALAERRALGPDMVERVSTRTGGVPLFVEEVTRLLLDGGAQSIPPTLAQSLAARLDRLGDAREIAQVGAVLGREFSRALLQAAAGIGPAKLDAAIAKLSDSGLLLGEGEAPNAVYRFKHALIQDAAYHSLLKSQRQRLHRRAAEALADAGASRPELLAHHFTEAGMAGEALDWRERAGQSALRSYAFQEAIAHLRRAMEIAGRLAPDDSDRHARLRRDYAQAVMWVKGFAAEETRTALTAAERLAPADAAQDAGLRAAHATFLGYLTRGDMASAKATARRFLADAQSASDALVGRRLVGFIHVIEGEFVAARDSLAPALTQFAASARGAPDLSLGLEPLSAGQSVLGMALMAIGDLAGAEAQFDEATRRAEELESAPSLANVWAQRLIMDAILGDAARVEPLAQRLIELAQARQMDFYARAGELYLAWAQCRRREPGAGLAALALALRRYQDQGNSLSLPVYLQLLADAARRAGQGERALALVEEALAISAASGQRGSDALLLASRGAVLSRRAATHERAEAALRDALGLAGRQGARSFALIVAAPLAELLEATGRRAEARSLLSRAKEGFERSSSARAAGVLQRFARD